MSLLLSLTILLIIIIIAAFIILLNSYRKIKLLNKKNQHLTQLAESHKKELTIKALQLANMNETLLTALKKIKKLPIQKGESNDIKLKRIANDIQKNVKEEARKEFEVRFSELNSLFYKKLLDKSPDLTQTELRICGMLHLNLTSKEIAQINNRNLRTIENTRSNIRKKLALRDDENLVTFLLNI